MAIFHMEIRPIKRSAGQHATGAAAYRAGEKIVDERTGDVHNHSRRKDVRHSEIFLPSKLEGSNAAWARDRAQLWNTAEAAEKRRNSRVAREYQVALPPELTAERRLALARAFSRELADRYGVAVDLAIHDPKPGRESQNFHAHMLTTTREVTPTGLGAKTGLDMPNVARAQRGLASHSEEYSTLRERWATLTNQALREANVEARVDHRSLAAQGIDRKPLLHIPLEFYQLERNGMPKEAAERLREDYRARLSAYREQSAAPRFVETGAEFGAPGTSPTAALPAVAGAAHSAVPAGALGTMSTATPSAAPVVAHTAVPRTDLAAASPALPSGVPTAAPAIAPTTAPSISPAITPRNSEEIRRRAVQAWLRMRSKEGESTKGASNEVAVSRGTDEGRDL
ncbi:MAG TPA: MobQ family relaxase [Steroidobacteraceae bacterium]